MKVPTADYGLVYLGQQFSENINYRLPMNIETLRNYAETFTREVVDSGFKRDLEDFISSLPASQTNILALREIAEKVLNVLDQLHSGDLPGALEALLPTKKIRPFTEGGHIEGLRSLLENVEIPLADFFADLNVKLPKLKQQIDQNIEAIAALVQFLNPYMAADIKHLSDENQAILAIVFKDRNSITNLKQFAKTISAWSRTLPVYHQLLKSDSPEDIRIVEVQNGSIDLIINLDVDVAIDLAEVIKVGFKVFGAYLLYKKMAKPLIESYHGNAKLIKTEEDREILLLQNIGEAVRSEISKQHKTAKKANSKVEATSLQVKIQQVADLITSHIVKGNDVKLLALPEGERTAAGEIKEDIDHAKELRESSLIARRALLEISDEAQQKLLETYGKLGDTKED